MISRRDCGGEINAREMATVLAKMSPEQQGRRNNNRSTV